MYTVHVQCTNFPTSQPNFPSQLPNFPGCPLNKVGFSLTSQLRLALHVDDSMTMFPRLGSPPSGDNEGPVPESVAAIRDCHVMICYELNGVVFRAKGRPGTDVYCIWHCDFTDWFDGDFRKMQSLIFHHLLEPSNNPWRPRERGEQCFFLCRGSAPNPERKVRSVREFSTGIP